MDISTITDLTQLKAMAYDQIAAKEQATNNLQAINSRIVELGQLPVPPVPVKPENNPPEPEEKPTE